VRADREEKELAVARLEAQLAQQKLELLEVKRQERLFARRDLAILAVQDRAKEQAEGESAPSTSLPVVEPPLSEPSADLGWLQADSFLFDPSLDTSSFDFPLGLDSAALDAVGGILLPIPCSS
jgi:hypothetical protein